MNKVLLYIFLTVPFISYSNTNNEQEVILKSKPTITMAYSWGYGFKNTIGEFKERVSDDFIIETEENIGLNHKQKILIDVSSNTIPDVFCFWSYETNLKYLADNGFLLDIDEYFKETEVVTKSDFYKESLEATEINGVNYAIPHERFFGFYAVNRRIFDKYNLEYPKYWSDFEKIAPVLNENGIIPLSMGSFRGDPGHLFFSALTYQHPDGYKNTQDMKTDNNFIYPGTKLAAEAVLDLIKYKAVPKNTIYEGSFDRQVDIYNKGEAASIFTFSWTLALFDKDIAKDTIIIPVPKINKNSIDTNSFTIGGTAQSICISKKAWENPDKRASIIKLVDWLVSDEVFNARMEQSGCYPTKKMKLPQMDNPIFNQATEYISGTELYGIHEFYFNSLNSFNQYKEANDLLWSGALKSDEFLQMVQDSMVIDYE